MLYCNRADADREVRREELRMTLNRNSIRMQEEQAMKKIQKSSKYPAAFLALRLWKCSYADRNNRAGDNGGCQFG